MATLQKAADIYGRDALMDRARRLVPVLRERAEATSRDRRIPDQTIADLWDADLWYLYKPVKFGGPAVPPDVIYEVAAELGRGDGSAAWVFSIVSVHDLFLCYFPLEAQQEFWAERKLSASSFMPGGKLTQAPGGYRLSGKWSFCSGVDASDWMILACIAGMISAEPPVPDIRFVLVPKAEVKVIDDWHVIGLRGTGSKSVAIDDTFVPEHRTIRLADLGQGTTPGSTLHDNPLYRIPTWAIFPFTISAPAAGIARGAFESFVNEMKSRVNQYGHDPLSKKPSMHLRVAEAAALIDAAELLYRRSLTETVRKVEAGETLSIEHRLRSRRDQAYSVKLARQATDILFTAEGGRGLYEHGHVQRAFRDLQAVQSHIVGGWDIPALNYGTVTLGNPPSDLFF